MLNPVIAATQPADGPPRPGNGFWPDLDPAHARLILRLADAIPPARLAQALDDAADAILRQLADYQAAHIAEGIDSAEAIPRAPWQRQDFYPAAYRRACYAQAAAILADAYPDITATGPGDDRSEVKASAADNHRRNAAHAVADILGRERCASELI